MLCGFWLKMKIIGSRTWLPLLQPNYKYTWTYCGAIAIEVTKTIHCISHFCFPALLPVAAGKLGQELVIIFIDQHMFLFEVRSLVDFGLFHLETRLS